MNYKLNAAKTASTLLLISGMILPAFANASLGLGAAANVGVSAGVESNAAGITVNTTVNASGTVRTNLIARAENRADEEISRRIKALNALIARVNAMVKVTSDEKASLSSDIQTQITAMQNLQAQISADASADATSSLKTDIQSITKSYRIFMLIIPVGSLDAAADRALDVAGIMATISTQLQARVSAAQASGTNVGSSTTILADMNAKIADANAQANAAVAEVSGLKPDNGDQATMEANLAAMKDARSKIQSAQQDLVAARKDAGTIVKVFLHLEISAHAAAETSSSQ